MYIISDFHFLNHVNIEGCCFILLLVWATDSSLLHLEPFWGELCNLFSSWIKNRQIFLKITEKKTRKNDTMVIYFRFLKDQSFPVS